MSGFGFSPFNPFDINRGSNPELITLEQMRSSVRQFMAPHPVIPVGTEDQTQINEAFQVAELWLDLATTFPRTTLGHDCAWSRTDWINSSLFSVRLNMPIATQFWVDFWRIARFILCSCCSRELASMRRWPPRVFQAINSPNSTIFCTVPSETCKTLALCLVLRYSISGVITFIFSFDFINSFEDLENKNEFRLNLSVYIERAVGNFLFSFCL